MKDRRGMKNERKVGRPRLSARIKPVLVRLRDPLLSAVEAEASKIGRTGLVVPIPEVVRSLLKDALKRRGYDLESEE